MDVNGKLVEVLPLKSGISKNTQKQWQSQSIIIDNGDDFNNLICVEAFGDKVKQLIDLKIGDQMNVLINLYSQKFGDNWYNKINGYMFSVSERNPQDILGNKDTMMNGDNAPF